MLFLIVQAADDIRDGDIDYQYLLLSRTNNRSTATIAYLTTQEKSFQKLRVEPKFDPGFNKQVAAGEFWIDTNAYGFIQNAWVTQVKYDNGRIVNCFPISMLSYQSGLADEFFIPHMSQLQQHCRFCGYFLEWLRDT